ncbi:hypothetical protein WN55_02182, partial [Dufourea novaeangliae]
DRVQTVGADHVVTQIHPDACVGSVVARRGMDRGGRQWYPCVRVITVAVEPFGQLSLWDPAERSEQDQSDVNVILIYNTWEECKVKVVMSNLDDNNDYYYYY